MRSSLDCWHCYCCATVKSTRPIFSIQTLAPLVNEIISGLLALLLLRNSKKAIALFLASKP
ncbi:MAG: hypothetical protein QNJ64_18760 [Crocosphaera sp.]|nr:hypothetical protein [Crocosphaera sp.]